MFLLSLSNDEILMNCQIPLSSPFSRIIFCKDGKEINIQEAKDNMFTYIIHYKISEEGAGKIYCMFQSKDEDNLVKNSGLSNTKYFPEVLGKKQTLF